ncbi:excalibur calcium-binding domain-containing protein [Streptomyces sp. NBC_01618]|uniref:excalibur calcium-binding domain-containing protein n=1 Tax=Streptomyces sp. NBC_01618 TaxID=2975900 RepID=UPI003864BE18|nr:excalibur calcium-binding domain-containing protein [Streptomyces sp. NBC_01618]
MSVAPADGDGDGGASGGSGSNGGGSGSAYYANCTAVRAAGAAPIHAGEPGYGRHLDRDGDGIGCE